MRIEKIYLIILLCGSTLIQSCGVNSNLMFKEVKGEDARVVYHMDSIPMFPVEDYRISPDDKIKFNIATNNGTKIIQQMAGISENIMITQANNREYVVRKNGEVELPVIGKTKIAGLTIEECEDTLAKLYDASYKDPFVQVEVTNKRVIVFPGNGSDASVVILNNSNTTLMEALASAGGITDRGKSKSIKLMRRVNGERVVYVIDLSTMKGLKHVDMVVQANDYIYVEPTAELAKELTQEIVPIISLLSSALFIVSAINLLK